MSFIFSRISRQKQCRTRSKTAKHGCYIGTRVSDLGDFWTTLKNQLANTPFGYTHIIDKIGCNGAHVTHFPTWNREKARANTCEGREMPWGRRNTSLGSLFGKRWNQYQYKGKAQKSNQYMENEGKAERFRRKNGEIRHIHIRWKEKIKRGKFQTPENNMFGSNHAHKDNLTTLCALILTRFGFPLFWFGKFSSGTLKTTKSLIESLYHHEASKTHTLRKQKQRTKAAKALPTVKAGDHRSNRRRRGIFDVLSS